MNPLECRIIVDNDPDNDGYYSLFTDEEAVNAELAGKIGSKDVADKLAKLWNESIST